MSRGLSLGLLLVLAILLLFIANLLVGSVSIPLGDAFAILLGNDTVKDTWRFIILESRLPQAIAALLAGGSLAVCGLMLQTAFANPLAGPDIFGINSGAGLAVALLMFVLGGSFIAGSMSVGGYLAILLAAFVGALAVTAVIFFFSTLVRNPVMLLIIGMMIGYLSGSVVTLLNFFATEEGVKSYMVWGMGSFSNVSMGQIPLFAAVTLVGVFLSLTRMKSLNALLLGEQYAENLGVNTRRVRRQLLLITGLLTAVTTAYCGPVAFIGLATPHVARLLLRTDNHLTLLPVTVLTGSVIALLCNLACTLPGESGIIPLNAVTPLVGAPVIIYVIVRGRHT